MGRKAIYAIGVLAASAAMVLGSIVPARAATTSQEWYFINKINHERTSRGGRALTVRSDLVTVARRWSEKQRAAGDISHNPNLANEVGGNWTVLGENVGVGASSESLHQAFMDSPGHRANVLDRDYNEVGVGIAVADDGMIFVTEVFAHRASKTSTPTTKPSTKPSAKPAAPPAPEPTASPRSQPQRRSPSQRAPQSQPQPQPATASTPGGDARNVEVLVQLFGLEG